MAFVPSAKLVQPAVRAVESRKAATTMKLDLPSVAAGLAPAILASPAFAAGKYFLLLCVYVCGEIVVMYCK